VGIEEWNSGVDLHGVNQERFGLPERRIAKTFLFRLIFGGNEWSYANDPDYSWISDQPKYWRKVIDGFCEKYSTWARWTDKLVNTVTREGHLTNPTGRQYFFTPQRRRGELTWPRTQIINHPVQGLASDWVKTGRVVLCQKLKDGHARGALLINSVHDSLVLDVPDDRVDAALRLLHDVVHLDTQKVFSALFNYRFQTNIKGEVMYGPNQNELKEWTP
jgi:DNA polymerase I-like protein with 3'-5' exonuclease and polymerase domains